MKPADSPGHPSIQGASIQGGIDALVECLEDEYRALLAEDHERLDAVLAHKEQLLSQLASLPAFGKPQSDRGRAKSPWKQALERVRQLNHRNAITLAPRLLANGARLRFLQSAMGRASVYAADGTVGGKPNFGLIPRGT